MTIGRVLQTCVGKGKGLKGTLQFPRRDDVVSFWVQTRQEIRLDLRFLGLSVVHVSGTGSEGGALMPSASVETLLHIMDGKVLGAGVPDAITPGTIPPLCHSHPSHALMLLAVAMAKQNQAGPSMNRIRFWCISNQPVKSRVLLPSLPAVPILLNGRY